MTWNDDAHHVFAIGTPDRAAHFNIAELLCHPRIRTRFADRNRTQNFPGAQLKRRTDRRQRSVEREVLACKKIAGMRPQHNTKGSVLERKINPEWQPQQMEISMSAAHTTGGKPVPKDPNFGPGRTPI